MKKTLSHYLALCAALFFTSFLSVAHAQGKLTEGQDYVSLTPPIPTENARVIEVVEFFSYACPHCNDLNAFIPQWKAKLPADVVFRRIPVGFNDPFYQQMARVFHTLEAIGELDRLDKELFSALHNKNLRLMGEKAVTEWAVSHGVDRKKFEEAYHSFGVQNQAKRSNQFAQLAKINAVPTLIVDGQYRVTGKNIRDFSDLLNLTNQIIEMRRQERAKK